MPLSAPAPTVLTMLLAGHAAGFRAPVGATRPTRTHANAPSMGWFDPPAPPLPPPVPPPAAAKGWFDGAMSFTRAPKEAPQPKAMGTGRAPKALPGFQKGKKYLKKGDTYTEVGGSRYEDGEDRRLSQGGLGGGNSLRKGTGNSYRNTESARFGSADPGQQIRKEKLEAYINSEYEASDGTFGKIISGSLLLSLFCLFIGVYQYYGADGLMTAARLG